MLVSFVRQPVVCTTGHTVISLWYMHCKAVVANLENSASKLSYYKSEPVRNIVKYVQDNMTHDAGVSLND